MRGIVLVFFVFIGFSVRCQEKKIPDGWDKITLNGSPAYMNLYTGDVSSTFPKQAAKKPVVIKELDPTIFHRIKKGETLFVIAKKYDISVDDIYRLNVVLDPKNLSEGQEIVVGYDESKKGKVVYQEVEDLYTKPKIHKKNKLLYPIKQEVSIAKEQKTKSVPAVLTKPLLASTQPIFHIVEKGETLYGIAKRFGIRVEDMKRLNNLHSNLIKVGQKLLVKD